MSPNPKELIKYLEVRMKRWYTGFTGQSYPSKKAEVSAACKSEYLWWIAFLRFSQDYWWVCHEHGECLDARLNSVWRMFGNIFDYTTFEDWLVAHAEDVFAENLMAPKVSDTTIQSQLIMMEQGGHVIFEIPLHLADQDVLEQVLALINRYSSTARQFKSSAKYSLIITKTNERKQMPHFYQMGLLDRLVDCINQIDQLSNIRLAKMRCYEMGIAVNISPSSTLYRQDNQETRLVKQNRVRSLVCQKKKQAEALIANVEIGRFPSRDPVKSKQRWSTCQRQEMKQAIANR